MEEIAVEPLILGSVQLPEWHPRFADGECLIQSFIIHHPDGPILVDTGVGSDNDFVNEVYRPTVVPIVAALNDAGIDERDLVGIVNTHLHFDHCGQTRFLLGVPVYVQDEEVKAAEVEFFTVPDWAAIEPSRLRRVFGDDEIAPQLRLLSTPGHTPGHQSILIEGNSLGSKLIVGQSCYTCAAFAAEGVDHSDLHDESFLSVGLESLTRLRALEPTFAYFSHDPTIFNRSND